MSYKNIKIVFMGTPLFAAENLKALIDEFSVEAVFTQMDKPKGRGNKLTPSEVKTVALENGIKVFEPKKLRDDKDSIKALKEINPDFIIVVAYGQILSKEVLDIPKIACINLHASILPKYRGASPIQSAVLNGDTFSGNTTMLMDEGLDTGDILLQSKVEMTNTITYGQLHDLLMEDGKKLLIKTITELNENKLIKIKQDEKLASYSGKIEKKDERIDFSKSAEEIHNKVRGLNPIPLAYTTLNDSIIKFVETEVLNYEKDLKEDFKNVENGKVLEILKDRFNVKCSEGILSVLKVQPQGKKIMSAKDFLNGKKLNLNDQFI